MEPKAIFDLLVDHLGADAAEWRDNDLEPFACVSTARIADACTFLRDDARLEFNQLMLNQALKWGVTYWDTAASYMGGKSEKTIGRYIAKYPDVRKKIFLVTKSHAWTLKGLTRDLDRSLKRLKSGYIDLFFKHAVRDPGDLDDDLKVWAEKAKSE